MIYLNLPEVSGTNKEIGQNVDRKCEPVEIGLNENKYRTATERWKRFVRKTDIFAGAKGEG